MTNDELLKLRKFQTPKFFNFQITKYKYQTNYNNRNTNFQTIDLWYGVTAFNVLVIEY